MFLSAAWLAAACPIFLLVYREIAPSRHEMEVFLIPLSIFILIVKILSLNHWVKPLPKKLNPVIRWPLTSRLKPRSIEAPDLHSSTMQTDNMLSRAEGCGMRAEWHGTKMTSSIGYQFDISSLGALTSVLDKAFFCTPDTLKVNLQGYQQ